MPNHKGVLRQAVADKRAALETAKAAGRAAIEAGQVLTDEQRAAVTTAQADLDAAERQMADYEALAAADRQPDAPLAGTRVEMGEDRSTKAPGYFGRQLLAIRRIALSAKGMLDGRPSAEDFALVKPMAAPTGMNTDVPAEGGFLVAAERSSTILQRAYSVGQVLSRVRRMPIGAGSNGMKFPAIDETSRANSSRYGGIVSTWVGQGTQVTSGKPKIREIELKLRKVMATVYATDEQLVDAVALEGWINTYLPMELQFRVEDAVINGVGSNQPLGVMQSPALVSVTRNTASRILFEDVQGMWLRMYAPCRANAVWFVEQSAEGQFEQLAIAIGTGGTLAPVYKPAGSVPGQGFATLYGRPVVPVEYCAALGTAGDFILTDLGEYVLIDKGAVEQAVSLHVAFLTDEQVFRFIYRVDGQCIWNSALTPKSGGNSLTCVVALT